MKQSLNSFHPRSPKEGEGLGSPTLSCTIDKVYCAQPPPPKVKRNNNTYIFFYKGY